MYGGPHYGQRVDLNRDGIPDVKIGPYGQVRPDVGSYVHGPQAYGAPGYGAPGYGAPGYGMPHGGQRIDLNRDGIPDVKVGPYGQVRPDVGSYVHGPYGGPQPGYYPHY